VEQPDDDASIKSLDVDNQIEHQLSKENRDHKEDLDESMADTLSVQKDIEDDEYGSKKTHSQNHRNKDLNHNSKLDLIDKDTILKVIFTPEAFKLPYI